MAQDFQKASCEVVRAIVDDISPDGIVRVILNGQEHAREAASVLRYSSAAEASEALLGRTVLVLVDDQSQPVILGVISERVWDRDPAGAPVDARVTFREGSKLVQLDNRRAELEASEEIRLTCGKSSLVLRRDGTVIIRGVNITSRALQANKVRGATISLN
jgi:hypothetical protein